MQIAENPIVGITTGGDLGRRNQSGVDSYESIKKDLGARHFLIWRIVCGGGTGASRAGRH